MRVMYAEGPGCTEQTFKRLLLVANGIGFFDQPQVKLSATSGIASSPSAMRLNLTPEILNGPVEITFQHPASRETGLDDVVDRDLRDLALRRLVIQGLAEDRVFRESILPSDGTYGLATAAEIAAALVAAGPSLDALDLARSHDLGDAFQLSSPNGLRDTLRTLVIAASTTASIALSSSEATGFAPVAESPTRARILATRSEATTAVRPAESLGLAVINAVIDAATLQRLTILDILRFRRETADLYTAWELEIERLALMLDDLPPGDVARGAQRLMTSEIRPKLHACRQEMVSVREKLFGDLVKGAIAAVPSLLAAQLFSPPLAVTAALAAGGAVAAAAVDRIVGGHTAARKHALAYLIRIEEAANG